ncbi:MAG: NAD(P)-dependent oxidoreductase [Candidatus Eisenbacteria bacterium]|uniref:NAD(P)-dependent oxidoreductase n=1 Tax=Eiseniibacteriota bacterium TaxID=2212470 RepID=A0A956NGD4_UNCEI|nr:NAD(P)-dependent oxidoreductase [Candidatus Eisenbacteria bacterium]MCB9463815.1 NAD(P)-dependent oxidoreductase [Candidatus Eisenbacteria bacterium]
MRVAITGATGFLGGHIAETFAGLGWELSLLARSSDRAETVAHLGRTVVGDITDAKALDTLFAGADVGIHLVSNFRSASGPPESYHQTNVRGTQEAVGAARRAGVRRFVHCSTIGVHGHVRSTPADETSPFHPGDLYQETKAEAELWVQSEARKPGMEIVVVRPCSIYGPGDTRMLKMFRMLAKRTFFTLGACRENFHAVYIDDLIEGFRLVSTQPGIQGEAFILGGPRYLPLWDYLVTAASAAGAPPPWMRFPYSPVFAASVVCEKLCVPLRIEPPLHPRRVRFFRNNRAFSIDKARRSLGYDPRVSLEEGMERTVAWYRSQGLL